MQRFLCSWSVYRKVSVARLLLTVNLVLKRRNASSVGGVCTGRCQLAELVQERLGRLVSGRALLLKGGGERVTCIKDGKHL